MKKLIGVIKKIKLRTLLLLIVTLLFSSYAWFIFISEVSVGLEAHVVAWHVTFEVDEQETTEIDIDIGQIYPGMDDYTKEIVITNDGEVAGTLTYQIQRMVVLGTTYELSDDPLDEVTPDDLEDILENDFPFSISVTINGQNNNIIPINLERTVTITVEWPIDGNDEIDTQWGEDAYDYYQTNGADSVSVHIELLLRVEQAD